MPISASFFERAWNVLGGRRLRLRALVIDCGDRLAILAAAVVPPRASITADADWRITMMANIHGQYIKSQSRKNGLQRFPEPEYGSAAMAPSNTLEVADRLRYSRMALKLTQRRLCSITGIETNTWNNAETAKARLGIDSAIQLCDATGLTLDWVYRGIKTGLPLTIAEALQKIEADPPPRRHK
jgi:DNA-binding XRE family transcriptional regulator